MPCGSFEPRGGYFSPEKQTPQDIAAFAGWYLALDRASGLGPGGNVDYFA